MIFARRAPGYILLHNLLDFSARTALATHRASYSLRTPAALTSSRTIAPPASRDIASHLRSRIAGFARSGTYRRAAAQHAPACCAHHIAPLPARAAPLRITMALIMDIA